MNFGFIFLFQVYLIEYFHRVDVPAVLSSNIIILDFGISTSSKYANNSFTLRRDFTPNNINNKFERKNVLRGLI